MKTVIVQKWEESELGLGCRPDGYSLHLNEQLRSDYIQAYWDRMPDSPPEVYTRPDGTPYLTEINDEGYNKLVEAGGSSRHNGRPPGNGGVDGWIPRDRN